VAVVGRSGAPVFLTGATGFIGGRLARALSARGYRLRCLVRDPARADALRELGAELVRGDAADGAVLADAMSDVELACHVAGRYDLGRVDARAMERVNVGGTRAFVEALRRSPVQRAVYVSTTAALGPVEHGEGDEQSENRGPYRSVYERTKTEAHRIARAAQQEGLPLVIACPALVYGPGDVGPSGRAIEDVLRHRIPGLPSRPSWYSYVHVDDLVAGLIAALERGTAGATYVFSGEHATTTRFTEMAAALGGTWVSPLRIPPVLVRATGVLMDAVSRLTGARLPISRELADMAAAGDRWVHSYRRAALELGYAPRTLAEGMPETVRWVKERITGS
jgi:dihydroflavonol-4-reductase